MGSKGACVWHLVHTYWSKAQRFPPACGSVYWLRKRAFFFGRNRKKKRTCICAYPQPRIRHRPPPRRQQRSRRTASLSTHAGGILSGGSAGPAAVFRCRPPPFQQHKHQPPPPGSYFSARNGDAVWARYSPLPPRRPLPCLVRLPTFSYCFQPPEATRLLFPLIAIVISSTISVVYIRIALCHLASCIYRFDFFVLFSLLRACACCIILVYIYTSFVSHHPSSSSRPKRPLLQPAM